MPIRTETLSDRSSELLNRSSELLNRSLGVKFKRLFHLQTISDGTGSALTTWSAVATPFAPGPKIMVNM